MSDKEKLENVKKAIDNLEGVMIPFDVIKRYLVPFAKWLDNEVSKF